MAYSYRFPIECRLCGTAFLAARSSAMYCSRQCNCKAWYLANKEHSLASSKKRAQIKSAANPNSIKNKLQRTGPRLIQDNTAVVLIEKLDGTQFEMLLDVDDIPLVEGKRLFLNTSQYAHGWKVGAIHRAVIGASKDEWVDHINGNRLDNRKSNLRIATASQNAQNRGPQKIGRTKYKGIYYTRSSRWGAWLKCNGKRYYLGIYATPEEAARAYDKFARVRFGEFAWLNFPQEVPATQ